MGTRASQRRSALGMVEPARKQPVRQMLVTSAEAGAPVEPRLTKCCFWQPHSPISMWPVSLLLLRQAQKLTVQGSYCLALALGTLAMQTDRKRESAVLLLRASVAALDAASERVDRKARPGRWCLRLLILL